MRFERKVAKKIATSAVVPDVAILLLCFSRMRGVGACVVVRIYLPKLRPPLLRSVLPRDAGCEVVRRCGRSALELFRCGVPWLGATCGRWR